jgi:hypothetical protein
MPFSGLVINQLRFGFFACGDSFAYTFDTTRTNVYYLFHHLERSASERANHWWIGGDFGGLFSQ